MIFFILSRLFVAFVYNRARLYSDYQTRRYISITTRAYLVITTLLATLFVAQIGFVSSIADVLSLFRIFYDLQSYNIIVVSIIAIIISIRFIVNNRNKLFAR